MEKEKWSKTPSIEYTRHFNGVRHFSSVQRSSRAKVFFLKCFQQFRKIHWKIIAMRFLILRIESPTQVFSVNFTKSLTLYCLVSTERPHLFKQTCSFQLQVCLSMCDLSVDTRHQRVKNKYFAKYLQASVSIYR